MRLLKNWISGSRPVTVINRLPIGTAHHNENAPKEEPPEIKTGQEFNI
jgi:hypothetical protein